MAKAVLMSGHSNITELARSKMANAGYKVDILSVANDLYTVIKTYQIDLAMFVLSRTYIDEQAETIRKIHESHPDMPVFSIVAKPDPELHDKAMAAGVRAVIDGSAPAWTLEFERALQGLKKT